MSDVIPNVFLVGAAKSGTTSLATMLSRHREVYLPSTKEPEFFSFDSNFGRGLDWYKELYREAGNAKVVLDASTGYSRYPEIPATVERLRSQTPDAKIIYLMRDPVDRSFSHYVHRWSTELHPNTPFRVSFEEHIESDTMCINSSDYKLQLEQYLDCFPAESVLCLFTHQLRQSPQEVLAKAWEFMGVSVDQSSLEKDVRQNETAAYLDSRVRVAITNRLKSNWIVARSMSIVPRPARELAYRILRRTAFGKKVANGFEPPKMKPQTRKRLQSRFKSSNHWVSSFTNTDLSLWAA